MTHNAKFNWTQMQQTVFKTLKRALIKAPILHYPDPSKHYTVYSDASDDTHRAQLSKEHDGQELAVVFHFSHIPSQKRNRNGAALNRKLMGYTMP